MATRPKFAKLANYSCECVEASHIFLKSGECRTWANVLSPGKLVGECRANVSSPGKLVGECRANVSSPGKLVGECWRKQDRSFYAQITYFICIKRSSLHWLNSPNSLNSLNLCKSCQICLSRMYRVRGKWLTNVGRMYRVRGKWLANVGQMYRVQPIFQNGHFGEYSNSTNSPASGHCLSLKEQKHLSFQNKMVVFCYRTSVAVGFLCRLLSRLHLSGNLNLHLPQLFGDKILRFSFQVEWKKPIQRALQVKYFRESF